MRPLTHLEHQEERWIISGFGEVWSLVAWAIARYLEGKI